MPRLEEKPRSACFVNAGIYLLEPAVYEYVPRASSFDMTDLIERLLDAGKRGRRLSDPRILARHRSARRITGRRRTTARAGGSRE